VHVHASLPAAKGEGDQLRKKNVARVQKPRPLKKRKRKLTRKQQAERAKRRKNAQNALSKRKARASPEAVRKQRELDNARCVDIEALRAKCTTSEDRPGCWIWAGRHLASWGVPKPIMTAGQYGRMVATRAMWKALGRRGLENPRNYVKASCGHDDCIAPEHLTLTSYYRELAKQALKR
jgi:hypothetical protein